jgi:ferritin
MFDWDVLPSVTHITPSHRWVEDVARLRHLNNEVCITVSPNLGEEMSHVQYLVRYLGSGTHNITVILKSVLKVSLKVEDVARLRHLNNEVCITMSPNLGEEMSHVQYLVRYLGSGTHNITVILKSVLKVSLKVCSDRWTRVFDDITPRD